MYAEIVTATRSQQFRRELDFHLVLIHTDIDEQPQRQASGTKGRSDLGRTPIEESTGSSEPLNDSRVECFRLCPCVGCGIDMGKSAVSDDREVDYPRSPRPAVGTGARDFARLDG